MIKVKNYLIDCGAMFKRSFKLTIRSPEAVFVSAFLPAAMMWLFVSVFGNMFHVNFIMPAILILSIGQSASSVALSVNIDINKGIVDRFLSMPIYRSSILFAQSLTQLLKSAVACAIVIGVAFALGYRTEAGALQWMGGLGLVLLITFALTWLFILLGMSVKSTEVAGLLMVPPMILPYLSTGFTSAEGMSRGLAWFATHQPLTPMIESLRSLFLGAPVANYHIFPAIAWCIGIIAFSFIMCSVLLYRRTKK